MASKEIRTEQIAMGKNILDICIILPQWQRFVTGYP